jgi:hypothetical protein
LGRRRWQQAAKVVVLAGIAVWWEYLWSVEALL